MIAIHNILAVSATVGYKGSEGNIIKKTLLVCLAYALIAGIIGYGYFMFFLL
jgi:lactate permease